MKKALAKGLGESINVYTCTARHPNYVARSTFPWYYGEDQYDPRHGVTLGSDVVFGGTLEARNDGSTLVHEVGHWFGLSHTYGDCGDNYDNIADTPDELPGSVGCDTEMDSCPDHEGLDPQFNYMSDGYDYCRQEFTAGQKRRVYQMLNWYRTALLDN